ncbi:YecA/YgfB family protein [Novosphingobium naphthalenivorans]|uniref:YecA/YgfB family protein n=1 Tax=Novosphingobium naphthalenivorans TaxID=273168 RepID=UPI000833BC7A|nr:UPF0149 family protein [Novosphingobium naphthalenivorans]
MTTPQPHSAVLPALNWDADLLPPLEMDGYLTGTLLIPDLEASEWIAGLWGTVPSLADDSRLLQAFTTALTRRKEIEADLQRGWPGFRTSFCETRPGHKADHGKVRAWVKGFWKAMRLDPQYWSDLVDDERTADLVGLFVGFIEIGEGIDERDDADAIRDEHAQLLPRALVSLRKLALLQVGNATALQTMQANKVGRNQPCPCGSGKKFKRCCAAD